VNLKGAASVVNMERARTTFAIDGFTATEAAEGIPHLLAEFAERPILAFDAYWDEDEKQVIVTVETEDFGLDMAEAHSDLVWDCVFACINFSNGIRFRQI
jgi:hypothetical protein